MHAVALVPLPARGRVFTTQRRVRLGDVGLVDRLRLDAIARYLQDIARDDAVDAGLENPLGWVVRWTVLEVIRPPVFQELLTLATWCSGVGSRWAERRTSVTGEQGGAVEAATCWVHLDLESGRPAKLGPSFHACYDQAAGGRVASTGFALRPRPAAPGTTRPWPLRATDFDVLGHVNNAAYAAAVEDVLAARPALSTGVRVVLEYREPVVPGASPQLAVTDGEGGVDIAMRSDGTVHLLAAVRPRR